MITLRQRYQLPAGEQNAPLNGNKTDTPRENAQERAGQLGGKAGMVSKPGSALLVKWPQVIY